MTASDPSPPNRRAGRSRWLTVARLVVAALVLWGIVHTVRKAWHELQRHQTRWSDQIRQFDEQLQKTAPGTPAYFALVKQRQQLERMRLDWRNIAWTRLVGCALTYAAATGCGWLFWWVTLRQLGQRPSLWGSFRAYEIGQLGKYVPGKAMVVILRTALVQSEAVATWAAVTAVFIETLTFMAVGAAWAMVLLPWIRTTDQTHAWTMATVVVGLLAGLPTLPPLFRPLLVRALKHRLGNDASRSLAQVNLRLTLIGWALSAAGWWLIALSFWFISLALPGDRRAWTESFGDLPSLLVAASLAVVLGFASFLPGGVGVRELVIYAVLAPMPHYGALRALALALLVRVVWLGTELLLAVPLYLLPCSPSNANVTDKEPTGRRWEATR